MSRRGTAHGRRLGAVAILLLLLQLVWAGPAAAHAELVGSNPVDGARLDASPGQVTLTFSEDVDLIDHGMRLIDNTGSPLDAGQPSADGGTVRMTVPKDLPDGRYLVNWRVISSDGHPIEGAIAFGIGVTAASVGQPVGAQSAGWPVTAARYLGYLGFALVAGVVAFVLFCAPEMRDHRRTEWLARAGILVGLLATGAALLVQGPYVAGVSSARLFDADLLAETYRTSFGMWMLWRLVLYAALALLVWRLVWLNGPVTRWLAGLLTVIVAFTFSTTGHAAATGRLLDRFADTVHVLTAGIWVGGLVLLAVLGRSMGAQPVQRFSRLALGSVLALVATGVFNSLVRLDRLDELWTSRYGQMLLAKLFLVAATLAAAAVSRQAVRGRTSPWQSVRVEAVATVAVLGVTAALSLTSPPARVTAADLEAAGAALGSNAAPLTGPTEATVRMSLGQGRAAELHLLGTDTQGSQLHLVLLDSKGAQLKARRVDLKASLPQGDVGPIAVPLTRTADDWTGTFAFPLPGAWQLALTVEDASLSGVLTTGDVQIGG